MPTRVLLIEDNPADARLIAVHLEKTDLPDITFELCWVDNLPAGLEKIRAGGIDVILLDLGLPESSGLGTVNRLFAQRDVVPALVVLSGLNDDVTAITAVKSGAQDYLVKGQVNSISLVRAIRYAIERRHANATLRSEHAELGKRVVERTRELRHAVEALHLQIAERRRVEETQTTRPTELDQFPPNDNSRTRQP